MKAELTKAIAAIENSVCFRETIIGQMKLQELKKKLQNLPVETPKKTKSPSYDKQAIYYHNQNVEKRRRAYAETFRLLSNATHAQRIKIVRNFKERRLCTTEAELAKWHCVKENFPEVLTSIKFIKLYEKRSG